MANQNEIIPEENEENIGFLPKISKENMKSIFYMISGKPDSYIKLFHGPICITPNDIIELNEMIQDKLITHNVTAAITSVNINYHQDEIEQYGIWEEFVHHRWNTHKETESITVKWDFLIKISSYEIPQRHTVVLKIASTLTPLHLMRAVFSQDTDEIEKLESEWAPVVCRIDFINHVLSDELMNIIEQWHKSRIRPIYNSKYEDFLDKYREIATKIIHYSIPLFFTFFSCGLLNKYISITSISNNALTVSIMKTFMFWLLGSVISILFMNRLGNWFGNELFNLIRNYGEHSIFNFTNGDRNKINKLDLKNKKVFRKFIGRIIEATLINLIFLIISIILF